MNRLAFDDLFCMCVSQLVNEFMQQAPPRPPHSFDMGQLLEEMQQIDQQSYRQAPQRGTHTAVIEYLIILSNAAEATLLKICGVPVQLPGSTSILLPHRFWNIC